MVKDSIDTKLDARYADDGRTLLHPIKAGWSWSKEENRMMWSKEQETEDGLKSTWTSRTERALKDIINSSNKTLRCMVETCEDFKDDKFYIPASSPYCRWRITWQQAWSTRPKTRR